MDKKNIKGLVLEKKLNIGSKSEYNAIVLMTKDVEYSLRRIGANAFDDPEIKKLVNKKINAVGLVEKNIFFLQSFTIETEMTTESSIKTIKKKPTKKS
ncbi:MAG: hypothetical protein ABI851_14125 [Saprospiraceae bacterium]